jgi:3-methyladenine DNA glycosylase/8-oxoguanine DNA glycosylase
VPDLDLRLERPIDLRPILALHVRGPGDPTFRLARSSAWRATRTPDGPATVEIRINGRADGAELVARGWGPGAHSALEDVPALVGLLDDPSGFEPDAHPVVRDLARRLPNLRIGRTNRVMEALVPAILEQKVTGIEASRAFRALVLAHGEPAPGPVALGLRTPPAPAVLAGLPYHAYHPFGIEARDYKTCRQGRLP